MDGRSVIVVALIITSIGKLKFYCLDVFQRSNEQGQNTNCRLLSLGIWQTGGARKLRRFSLNLTTMKKISFTQKLGLEAQLTFRGTH